jgi:general secretion pathway protein F
MKKYWMEQPLLKSTLVMKYKVWFQKDNRLQTLICDGENFPHNVVKKKRLEDIKKVSFFHKTNLMEFFYEMKIMLEAKIAFKDVIELLLQSNNSPHILKILSNIQQSLQNGQMVYKALYLHKSILGKVPIMFFKFGEENGNMQGAIVALYELLSELESMKKKIYNGLKYPIVLLISLVISLYIIFHFVIPQFEHLFLQYNNQLPNSTKMLLAVQNFFIQNSALLVFLFVGFIMLLLFCIKNYRTVVDKIVYSHIPYFSFVYQRIIIYRLFIALYFITNSKVRFQNALISTIGMLDNRFVEEKLKIIVDDIQNGVPISKAFLKSGLFDESTIRLLYSGEKANKLESVLYDIKELNKQKLNKSIENFSAIIEPVLIFFIAIIILWIVLAIMTPIWELGNLMN